MPINVNVKPNANSKAIANTGYLQIIHTTKGPIWYEYQIPKAMPKPINKGNRQTRTNDRITKYPPKNPISKL